MTRKIRNTVILVKPATVPGADAAPTGAANAVQVVEMTITPLDAQNIERKLMRGSFGANPDLVGPASVKCSMTVELSGSGTAATPPAWGNIILGCSMAEGILATPARVEYTPVSTGQKDVTIYYYDDGVLHKLIGAMGSPSLTAKIGERALLKFDFVGVDGVATAAANVVPVLTAWKPPVAITKANVIDIVLGCTYAAGAISGGTPYASNGIEINWNNEVNFLANCSTEKVDIADRKPTGSFELELSAADEVALLNSVKANTLQGMAFQIGLNSGNQILVYAPAMQMKNPKKVDVKGTRYVGYDLGFLPVSGNDETRLVCL